MRLNLNNKGDNLTEFKDEIKNQLVPELKETIL